ncbi:MAG TPA: ABC transporter permease [Phototrophicaceae bacterium]|nr:ABC transporter permease [Phototrophicaceae bacterium]
MNGHVARVFLYELRRGLRRKAYLFTTFGIPLIGILLVFGYEFINQRTTSPQQDNRAAAQALADQFDFSSIGHAGYVDLSGLFSDAGSLSPLLTRYPDEASAQAALEAGKIPLYYVIAADYLQTGDVTLVQPRLDLGSVEDAPIQRLILNTLSKGVDPQVFQRLIDPSNVQATNLSLITTQVDKGNGGSFIVVYVFAIALLIGLFTTNGYLMQSVIEEKETRLIEILLSSLRPAQLLIGKILAMGVVGLLQLVVWIGSVFLIVKLAGGSSLDQTVNMLATIAKIQIPTNILPLLLIYFVLAYFMFAGFYSIVGALSNSLREGPQYAVIFTLPAALPLYFLSIFSTSPDATIPVIFSIFPITAPMAMVERIVISNVPTWQIALSLVLLALTTLAVMWVAGRIFRVQILLAGQMPKLRDIPKLIRG